MPFIRGQSKVWKTETLARTSKGTATIKDYCILDTCLHFK